MKRGTPEKKLGRFSPVFTPDQEILLVDHIKRMDRMFYGLTIDSLCTFANGFAEANDVLLPFKDGQAGRGWCKGFLDRHLELSLRKPESTSLARAAGFNKPQVQRFFQLLRSLYIRYSFRACDVYNCDESGFQTSANRPPKLISVKGKKQVGVISTAERGKTVTASCCCNSVGQFIPPALIFPRKRMLPQLMVGSPLGLCSESGWVNSQLFFEWMFFL